uniref:Uncharacterized protein n=1 Tax=Meloidogyne incognita TaxID=6306 RepID=A0A914MFG5_MELIC
MFPSNQQQPQQQNINGEQSSSSNLFKNCSKSPSAYDLKIARKKRQNNNKKPVGSNKDVNKSSAQIPAANTLDSPKKAAIRVGSNFQVLSLPEPNGVKNPDNENPTDLCLWKKHQMINDSQVANYCIDAYTNFGIEPDRALYILYKADYDFDKSRLELHNKHIFNRDFNNDDAYAFRNAFTYFGKNFARVRQIIPHKSLGSLVEHYYKTKKKQNFKCGYKRYVDIEANCSFSSSDDDNTDSNSDTMFASKKVSQKVSEEVCQVCKEVTNKIYSVTGLKVCKTCHLYFRVNNQHRVFPQPAEEPKRQKLKCPLDMRQICDQFVDMAKYVTVGDDSMEEEITVLEGKTVCEVKIQEMVTNQQLLKANTKRLIQNIDQQKNFEGCQKYSFVDALEFLSKTQNSFNLQKQNKNVNNKWLPPEKQAIFHALIQFDADENIVAQIIPTKTPAMIKRFYMEFKDMIDEEIHKRIMETDNFDFNGQGCSNNSNNSSKDEPEVIELD